MKATVLQQFYPRIPDAPWPFLATPSLFSLAPMLKVCFDLEAKGDAVHKNQPPVAGKIAMLRALKARADNSYVRFAKCDHKSVDGVFFDVFSFSSQTPSRSQFFCVDFVSVFDF